MKSPRKNTIKFTEVEYMLEHNQFKENLVREIDELQETQKQLKARLTGAPEGTLNLLQKNQNVQYYIYREGRKRQYLSKKKKDLAAALAQKAYDSKVLSIVEARLKYGKRMLDEYHVSIDDMYQAMPAARQALVSPCIPAEEAYVREWYEKNPGRENPYPILQKIFSERGEPVRSKSEKILADLFYRNQIPYVYEPKVWMQDGRIVYPDFLLLNVRTRKAYVYEHFGMMDSPEYSQKASEKINYYMENGYHYGDRFLFSMETSKTPLNTKTVEKIIVKFLI